ncbi:dehydrogenase/reductase SDR family member 12 [Octopus bimaculoides]|uniref:dehydrogenase/reductase SDR family member 12 n=1 Tax=Octopus bimaculoides TaxID=37653 RepID=UPI00071DBE57|nr:dehydrogenase/reductase SDR family member 12 [Octopus bimaculoides]|eukprot:XP_014772293.1 PREDICTED: dehydrogenase/reductase SDR family member 12-like [Octopus bimaculoides]
MSLYRNGVWFLKGMKEYTKGGYEKASQHFQAPDLDINLKGRSFMVTGGSSGVGKSIVEDLAKRGAVVHLLCRNTERAETIKDQIKQTTGNEDITIHALDLSKPADVYKWAKNFAESDHKLDVLINNAGAMLNVKTVTLDGLDAGFAANTLAPHILTTQLISKLSQSDDARVIMVSSGGMLVQKLNVTDLQNDNSPYDGTMAYAHNKRQQVIMSEQYARKYPNIYFCSMHPGWADTPGVETAMPGFYSKMKDRLRTPQQGADTALWLAIASAPKSFVSGQFFQDRNPTSTHLPLAKTKCTPEEEVLFMNKLDDLVTKFSKNSSGDTLPGPGTTEDGEYASSSSSSTPKYSP